MGAPWDVVVVGSGPAGLFAGISAAQHGARVLILEGKERPGGKLPVSGGGRGNLTHAGEVDALLAHYHGGEKPKTAGRFLKPAFHCFSNRDLMAFFSSRGLHLRVESDGRVFPETYRAEDALRVVLDEAERSGVDLRPRSRVVWVEKGSRMFVVFPQGRTKPLAKGLTLILATGGRSYPSEGAKGDGYRLALRLGHRLIPPRPALVPLLVVPEGFAPFSGCAGIAVRDTWVTLIRGGRVLRNVRGDVLFTPRGFSGPAALDISRDAEAGDVLRVVLAAGSGDVRWGEGERRGRGGQTVPRALQELGVPLRVARALARALGLPPTVRLAELPRAARGRLAEVVGKGYGFPLAGTAGWEEAMVTRGGVRLAEVSPKSLESRVVPGLFFAGEILDIDGDCGGYNLQAAFSTGFLAGWAAARRTMTRSPRRGPRGPRRSMTTGEKEGDDGA